MPTICMFLGIIIRMFAETGGKHSLPHFHAIYGEHTASFTFEGDIITGNLPKKQIAFVKAWALLHTDELNANWQLLINGEETYKIAPLN